MKLILKAAALILSFALLNMPAAGAPVVPAPPGVDATSYLVQDFQSGRVLVQQDIDERVEPASLTKMMTVYVVATELAEGNVALEDLVTVSEKAWRMGGSKMFIEVDKQVSVEELLKGVIIQSGNDASVALAEHVSGTEEVFAAMMNQHAGRLGMKNSNFTNSTGWPDQDHYTTARDLAVLAAALIRDYPEVYSLHAVKEYTFNDIRQHNRNRLLWQDGSVDGIKTGHTDSAGYCLVSSALRDGMRLISVVMGTGGDNARIAASKALLNFGFRFYETRRLYRAGETVTTSRIWKGDSENVTLGLATDLFVTVPRGSVDELDAAAQVESTLIAPVSKGAMLGTLRVRLDGEELVSRPLTALESVGEGGFFDRLGDELRLFFQ